MSWEAIVITIATFCGPVAAIQVDRFLSNLREKQDRKLAVFRTLMATRGNTLAPDHVNALNAIPIEFYGHKPIIDAWQALYKHLHTDFTNDAWAVRKADLLIMLLTAMGNDLHYKFNSDEIESTYTPQGHSMIEKDRLAVLSGLAGIVSGGKAIRMELTNWPNQEG